MKNIGRGVIFGERKKCDESSEVIYTIFNHFELVNVNCKCKCSRNGSRGKMQSHDMAMKVLMASILNFLDGG